MIKVQLLDLALLKSDIAYPFFTGPIGFEETITNTLVQFLILFRNDIPVFCSCLQVYGVRLLWSFNTYFPFDYGDISL